MKKGPDLLILGAAGILGNTFTNSYQDIAIPFPHRRLDIRNLNALYKTIGRLKPKFLLNCAAITDVEKCERDKDLCWETNVVGVENLVEVAREFKTKLIHFSSDYAVNPVNTYGWSKKASEALISKEDLVVRTTFYSEKTSLIKALLKGEKVDAFTNIFFNPVSVYRLVNQTYLWRERKGTVNIFSNKKISWFDFAQKLAETLQISGALVKAKLYRGEETPRPLDRFVKSDISINLEKDLLEFKETIKHSAG